MPLTTINTPASKLLVAPHHDDGHADPASPQNPPQHHFVAPLHLVRKRIVETVNVYTVKFTTLMHTISQLLKKVLNAKIL